MTPIPTSAPPAPPAPPAPAGPGGWTTRYPWYILNQLDQLHTRLGYESGLLGEDEESVRLEIFTRLWNNYPTADFITVWYLWPGYSDWAAWKSNGAATLVDVQNGGYRYHSIMLYSRDDLASPRRETWR